MSREHKDSGIEWIGQIPKEWKICRLKSLSKIERGGSPRPIEDYISDTGYNWIKIGDTIKGNKYISTVRQKIDESGLSKTRLVHKGDLILTNSMSYGEPYILNVDGCIHDGWVAISELKIIDKEFLYYSLSSSVCKIQFGLQVAGGVVNNLNVDKIGTTLIVVPPFSEQQKIADYLDKVCGEADEMIALQEKMIEELKAYKQSVITEAVTKGLNPNSPMKDSGIDWIGEIPDGWKVTVLRRFANIILGKMLQPSAKSENDSIEQYICAKDVHFEGIDTSDLKKMYFNKNEKEIYQVKKGDLLVVEGGAGAAGSCVLKTDLTDTYIQNSILIVRPKQGIDIRYIHYFEFSLVKKGYVDYVCNKATIPHFTKDKLSSMPIPLPPLNEQQSIASYLDEKCADIGHLIALKQQKIEELKEYKKSVIYEYVTGKKEVV